MNKYHEDLVRKRITVVQSWLDGKIIQVKGSPSSPDSWIDYNIETSGDFPDILSRILEWRVKPEPRDLWVQFGPDGSLVQVHRQHPGKIKSDNTLAHFGELFD